MSSRRQVQVSDEIQQIVSVLLQREIKDPRIGFVTVTRVEISSDLKYSKIYVSVMGTPEEKRKTMEGLTASRGFIRRELAARMSIRFVPEITFKLDQSIEYSDNIARILNELKQAEAEKAAEMGGASGDDGSAIPEGDAAMDDSDSRETEEPAEHDVDANDSKPSPS